MIIGYLAIQGMDILHEPHVYSSSNTAKHALRQSLTLAPD